MRRAILAFLIALLAVTSALAQQAADPDYSVFVTNRSITSDGNTLILQFSVNNIGSAAAERVTARLFVETGDEQLIEEQTLRALGSNDSDTLTFNIDLATIPDGIVDFRLEVAKLKMKIALPSITISPASATSFPPPPHRALHGSRCQPQHLLRVQLLV
jgi:hypothetical protein